MATSKTIVFNTDELEVIASELAACSNSLTEINKRASKACRKVTKQGSGTWSLELSVRKMYEELVGEMNWGLLVLNMSIRSHKSIDKILKDKVDEIADVDMPNVGGASSSANSSSESTNTQLPPAEIRAIHIPENQPINEKSTYGGYHGYCCVLSFAAAMSIVHGHTTDPNDYVNVNNPPNCTLYDSETGKQYSRQAVDYARIYSDLSNGYPTVIHYNYSREDRNSQHWVTVVGLVEGADPNYLNENSFLILDSNDGREKPFSAIASEAKEGKKYYSIDVNGAVYFT